MKLMVYIHKPHVLCLGETWLKENSKQIDLQGYKTHRKDRKNGRGGGILIATRSDIKASLVNITEAQNSIIEAQVIEIDVEQEKIKLLHITPYNKNRYKPL